MALVVELVIHPVMRARPAVRHIAPPLRHSGHQATDLCREWMMLPVPGLIKPQDRLSRPCRGQLVQHRENRCRTNSSAEQHDGAALVLQREVPTWHADVEEVADAERPEAGSCRTV